MIFPQCVKHRNCNFILLFMDFHNTILENINLISENKITTNFVL